MAYNYDKFSASEYDLGNFKGPELGSKAPDSELVDVDGGTKHLLDFEGEFLVVELGSVTCPLFQSRREGMGQAVQRHPDVSFVILYVREAHPGGTIQQHASIEDKVACAGMVRNQDGEGRAILVDDLAGTAHKAYGEYPNAVFIINRNGCVVYRSDWNDWRAVHKALDQLKSGKPATAIALFKPAVPPVAISTLRRSGSGAGVDFIKSLPQLIWKNLLVRNFKVLTGAKTDTLPDAVC